MKKGLFAISIMAIVVMVIIQSCKKEDHTMQSNNNETSRTKLMNNGGGEDGRESKIREFVHRMNIVRENPNYEESKGWNYSKESTIWYIESAINYVYSYKLKYAGKEEHSDMYNVDSTFATVKVSTDGKNYNIVEIQQSYDAFVSKLTAQYANTQGENKFFVVSDIQDRSEGNSTLKLKQFSVIGIANRVLPISGWIWGLNMGDCSHNNTGIDAADVIETKLSSHRSIPTSPNGYYYYDNIDILSLGKYGYIIPLAVGIPHSDNQSSFMDFKLFMNPYSAGDVCISSSEINWYTNNILSIESTYEPIGKHIVFDDVIDEVYTPLYGTTPTHNRHKLQPHYGILKFRANIDPID